MTSKVGGERLGELMTDEDALWVAEAPEIQSALRELKSARESLREAGCETERQVKDAFEAGYIQGHEATLENRYNLEAATADFLSRQGVEL
jgi:hypothetical protein